MRPRPAGRASDRRRRFHPRRESRRRRRAEFPGSAPRSRSSEGSSKYSSMRAPASPRQASTASIACVVAGEEHYAGQNRRRDWAATSRSLRSPRPRCLPSRRTGRSNPCRGSAGSRRYAWSYAESGARGLGNRQRLLGARRAVGHPSGPRADRAHGAAYRRSGSCAIRWHWWRSCRRSTPRFPWGRADRIGRVRLRPHADPTSRTPGRPQRSPAWISRRLSFSRESSAPLRAPRPPVTPVPAPAMVTGCRPRRTPLRRKR